MATRLDRLLKLLDQGSTSSVRAAAAQQVGAVAASRKAALSSEAEAWTELLELTAKIVPLLHAKSGDTRQAGAMALEQICAQAGPWDVTRLTALELAPAPSLPDSLLTLVQFNLYDVLSQGNPLLGSSGDEYKGAGPSTEEDQTASRKMLKDLGIDETNDMDLDMELGLPVKAKSKAESAIPVPDNLSAREKNALKRKRKEEATQANKSVLSALCL
jgi:TATA-binding protein-associated factor